jgi:hypothetical protein
MSETIKLCAMITRAVFETDDEAREPYVEQAMRAKREHDEMRRELAEARAERMSTVKVLVDEAHERGRAAALADVTRAITELGVDVPTDALPLVMDIANMIAKANREGRASALREAADIARAHGGISAYYAIRQLAAEVEP